MTSNEKAYTLRTLCADDMFPMFTIISKIGIKEIKKCFSSDSVKAAIADKNADVKAVGVSVAVELCAILMENLPKCKDEIYTFLAQISGMSKKAVSQLSLSTFMHMIVDVFKKEEFVDFFQGVAELLK